jgi:molybdopterin-containing oxidoreductase family iron-sulfur binding subunit
MNTTRRGFLGAAAATLGAGLVSGCEKRLPRYLVPYSTPPDDTMPGVTELYRTLCRGCPSACGATVRVREGRAIGLDGHALHPVSRGGLCPHGLASIESLYWPERIGSPRAGGRELSWDEAERALAAGLQRARDEKKRIVVLSRPERGAMGIFVRSWLSALGQPPTQLVTFDPLERPWVREGTLRAFGVDAVPLYDIAAATFLLSLGDDLVEEGSPVEHARGLAELRSRGGSFVYVGPRLSLTAAAADQWLSVAPGSETSLVLGLARALLDRAGPGGPRAKLPDAVRARLGAYEPASVIARTGLSPEAFGRLVDDLARARPSLCVGPGRAVAGSDSATLVEAVALLNTVAGNLGTTVRWISRPSEAVSSMDPAEFARAASAGEIGAVVVHHADPLAYGQAFGSIARALQHVAFVAAFGNVLDETARTAHLFLPDHHFLETWSDDSPRPGVVAIQQPAMAPLLPTRAAADVLLSAGRAMGASAGLPTGTFAEFVRGRFEDKEVEQGGRFSEDRIQSLSLADGALSHVERPSLSGPSDGLPLVVAPSLRHPNALLPHGDLLQEIPDTLTRLPWTGWLDIHPATAAANKVGMGDLVAIDAGAGSVELPVNVTPGIREGVLAVPTGYAGALFEDRRAPLAFATRVRLRATGRKADLFPVVDPSQHGRPLARTVGKSSRSLPLAAPLPSMVPPVIHPEHRWGLAIDLDRCTGCEACVAACYVENNIPIVGPLECSRGRDMAWLHVQAFVDVRDGMACASVIPVGCQHCTNAPCEQVCPTYATYHTADGLNAMVYARCVGTRYCENNCPYNARAFNFFDHPRDPRAALGLNPDVTVRERGITEKCTFCVQRIRAGKEQAKFEGRPVRDGEIVPACVSVCPTSAMVFGDLQDPASRVSRSAAEGRAYRLLEELNTQPGVVYLARRSDRRGA